jgi:hypothetical protein
MIFLDKHNEHSESSGLYYKHVTIVIYTSSLNYDRKVKL